MHLVMFYKDDAFTSSYDLFMFFGINASLWTSQRGLLFKDFIQTGVIYQRGIQIPIFRRNQRRTLAWGEKIEIIKKKIAQIQMNIQNTCQGPQGPILVSNVNMFEEVDSRDCPPRFKGGQKWY